MIYAHHAINGFSRILLNEYEPHLAPEARRYLHMVRDNAQQMGCLVDDLLTFRAWSLSAQNSLFTPTTYASGAHRTAS